MTEEDLMKAAFAAILRGDYTERDRLCALAKEQMDARIRQGEMATKVKPIPLIRQPDGSYSVAKPWRH